MGGGEEPLTDGCAAKFLHARFQVYIQVWLSGDGAVQHFQRLAARQRTSIAGQLGYSKKHHHIALIAERRVAMEVYIFQQP